jgi:hypothetical protein
MGECSWNGPRFTFKMTSKKEVWNMVKVTLNCSKYLVNGLDTSKIQIVLRNAIDDILVKDRLWP